MHRFRAIASIMHRLDREAEPIFTFYDLERWPRGLARRLQEIGLMQPAEPAMCLSCRNCDDDCTIEPTMRLNPMNGKVEPYYYCRHSGIGPMHFDVEELQQWQMHLDRWVDWLAQQLGLPGSPGAVIPGRLYRLGQRATATGPLTIMVARAMGQIDAHGFLDGGPGGIPRGCALLLPANEPIAAIVDRLQPHVVLLADLLAWDAERCELDRSALVRHIESLRPPVPQDRWLTVKEASLLLMEDVSGLDIKRATARVSKAAGCGHFRTNGRTGAARRIDRDSFSTWRLQQRERELEAADAEE